MMYDRICRAAVRMYRAGLLTDWQCRRIVIDCFYITD